nr:hypothetical protein [Tanacetum cinerariifolium]
MTSEVNIDTLTIEQYLILTQRNQEPAMVKSEFRGMTKKDSEDMTIVEEPNETMILDRPFLATIRAQIDVFNKEISLEIREDRVLFDMDEGVTVHPWDDEGFEEEEQWDSGIKKTDYQPPFVNIETFEFKRFSYQGNGIRAVVNCSGDVTRLQALVDKKRIVITEEILAQGDDVQEHAEEEVATEVVPPTLTSPLPSSPVLDTCSALVLRVEGLENANAAQQLEIVKLKARVKKLERLNKDRISVDMETDERVELVVDQEKNAEVEGRHADKQAEIYNIDLDHSSKVLSMQEDDTEVQEANEVVTTAKLITEVVTTAVTQVVAASTPILAAKPKIFKIATAPAVSTRRRKRVVIRDPEKELHTDTPAETPTVKDKGKGILIEDPKPMKKKDQVEMDAEYAKKLQEELDKEHEEAYKQIDWNAALDHVQAKDP